VSGALGGFPCRYFRFSTIETYAICPSDGGAIEINSQLKDEVRETTTSGNRNVSTGSTLARRLLHRTAMRKIYAALPTPFAILRVSSGTCEDARNTTPPRKHDNALISVEKV
jgi:hypothetical protein